MRVLGETKIPFAAFVAVALYVVSLALPAIYFQDHPPLRGVSVLASGWRGVFGGEIAWFANVFFLLSVAACIFRLHTSSFFTSIGAIGVGLLSLRATEWWFNEGSPTLITELGPAFYVWIGSFVILAVDAARKRLSPPSVA